MPEPPKVCPKCGNEMKASDYEMVLPAANDTRVSKHPISDSAGMNLSAYYCQKCSFVELYCRNFFRPAV